MCSVISFRKNAPDDGQIGPKHVVREWYWNNKDLVLDNDGLLYVNINVQQDA
jgi:hypothetical protein